MIYIQIYYIEKKTYVYSNAFQRIRCNIIKVNSKINRTISIHIFYLCGSCDTIAIVASIWSHEWNRMGSHYSILLCFGWKYFGWQLNRKRYFHCLIRCIFGEMSDSFDKMEACVLDPVDNRLEWTFRCNGDLKLFWAFFLFKFMSYCAECFVTILFELPYTVIMLRKEKRKILLSC